MLKEVSGSWINFHSSCSRMRLLDQIILISYTRLLLNFWSATFMEVIFCLLRLLVQFHLYCLLLLVLSDLFILKVVGARMFGFPVACLPSWCPPALFWFDTLYYCGVFCLCLCCMLLIILVLTTFPLMFVDFSHIHESNYRVSHA